MSKVSYEAVGKYRRCGFANGAAELLHILCIVISGHL